MILEKEVEQSGIFNEAQRERFKPLIRVVAFVVLFCFLYQDLASSYGQPLHKTINALYTPSTQPTDTNGLNFSSLISPIESLFALPEAYAQPASDKDDPPTGSSLHTDRLFLKPVLPYYHPLFFPTVRQFVF